MASMVDQSQKLKIRPLFNPAASITDNTAQVSSIIDTQGFRSCTLVLEIGSWTDADATGTVLVEDGNVSTLTDNVAVADAYLTGTEAGMAPTFTNDNTACKIGYFGVKRYVRMTFTPAANTGALFVSGVAILGNNVTADQTDQKVT
jgi:hypothetical protein